jgi:hypothetical protein
MPHSPLGSFARTARRTPLWARWLLTLFAFALLIVAIRIVASRSVTSTAESSPTAEAEANRVGELVVATDEAPHSSPLRAGAPVGSALQSAIAIDVHSRIRHGELTGPLRSVRCAPSGGSRAGRRPFSCTVLSAGISYTFLAVADEHARTLTWCKSDPAPTSSGQPTAQINSRCQAYR